MLNIGIDIDNVISNFDEMLLDEYLQHDKKLRSKGIVDNIKYITRGMFDWSKEEQDDFYNNNIERIAANLDILQDADKYINKLKNEGHKIYIITGRDNGEYKKPFEMTEKWLNEKAINYDKLILTNAFKHDKFIECKKHDIDIMIDDSLQMCKNCNVNGIHTLLMDTSYSRHDNSITRVHNWEEIYKYISNYSKPKIKVILDTDTYNE